MEANAKPVALDETQVLELLSAHPLYPVQILEERHVQLISNDAIHSAIPYKTNGSWKMLVVASADRDRQLRSVLRGLMIFHIQQLCPAGISNCYDPMLRETWEKHATQLAEQYSDSDRDYILSFLDKPAPPVPMCSTCNRPLDV